ncbi:MAG: type II toxin-antitoxin system HicA family toxin [Candidatus Aminicenantes bacterium]|nr:type II toxin-antitoxin system HicA family toxin [Candidatus Aminicenantes bacterium]MDH5386212.1 type II toxin-antitoxin system HicA family toxin [Candidatus Aminicenantes bacterium]MDH5743150.1 type II toxin-antitoxin system HicA family toxin [Candidatus Aminicenantes bacterium]
MKSVSGKDFAKILKKNGWKLARIQGSHHIYMKNGRKERISLPIHGNRNLKLGLLRYFMKLAGIKESDL